MENGEKQTKDERIGHFLGFVAHRGCARDRGPNPALWVPDVPPTVPPPALEVLDERSRSSPGNQSWKLIRQTHRGGRGDRKHPARVPPTARPA